MLIRAGLSVLLLACLLPAQPTLTAVRVVEGLDGPLWVGAPALDRDRLFVCEQLGRVRIVRGGQLLAQPFLDVRALVVSGGGPTLHDSPWNR